jgi:hypothetical protein
MNVTVLGTNSDYTRIFSLYTGFTPTFSELVLPEDKWMTHLTPRMTRDEAIELFNHYRIWVEILQTKQPRIILSGDSYPNQPDFILRQLLQTTPSGDLLLFGKYSDRCDLYTQVGTVNVHSKDRDTAFNIYQTKSPYGGYAYSLTESGARKLVQLMISDPESLPDMINHLAEFGDVTTFSPSIIMPGTLGESNQPRYECRPSSEPTKWNIIWYLLIFFLVGFLLAYLVYVVSAGFTYQPRTEIVLSEFP